jgi:arylsulfatase A-like enzyme
MELRVDAGDRGTIVNSSMCPIGTLLFIRRQLLKALTGGLLILFVATRAQVAATEPPTRPPNLLLILAEDIGPQLSCYGEPGVRTPNLDRIANEGMRFTQCFTTAPVCSASRSALMTGRYQTAIGAHNHRTWEWRKPDLPVGVHPVTNYFRRAGYFSADIVAPSHHPLVGHNHERVPGGGGRGKTDLNFRCPEPPFEGSDWTQRRSGQPFFAQLTIFETHKSSPGWSLARRAPERVTPVDPTLVRLPPYWPEHPVARDEYANYLDAIMLADSFVGDILRRLEEESLLDQTIVVFMSDNGQCTFRGKQFLYDGGIHVPLIIRWPDGRHAGRVDDRLVSGVDIPAILLGLVGIDPPDNIDGRDLLHPAAAPRKHIFAARDRMDLAVDRMRAVRTHRWKYIRNYLPEIPYMQPNAYKEQRYPTWNLVKELARTDEATPEVARFAATRKPIEELYDLASDPHEMTNLAGVPAQYAILTELRAELDAWIAETKDHGAIMEDPLDVYRGYHGHLPGEPTP